MNLLKQSTAATLFVGPFVDSVDGVTAKTALTIAQADVRVSKAGAAFAQKNDATSATHGENGWYSFPINTTDTNTLGIIIFAIAKTGALPVWVQYTVVPAAVYDTLVSGTSRLDANVTQWSGTNVAAPDTAGYPKVTHKVGTGTGELAIASGRVESDMKLWKAVDADTQFKNLNGYLDDGLAQSGGASQITLRAGASAIDNAYTGAVIKFVAGTGIGTQPRRITGYVGATKVATVSPAWATQPDGTTYYIIMGPAA